MDDITKSYRFQRILYEAAQYRTLRRIFDADRDYPKEQDEQTSIGGGSMYHDQGFAGQKSQNGST